MLCTCNNTHSCNIKHVHTVLQHACNYNDRFHLCTYMLHPRPIHTDMLICRLLQRSQTWAKTCLVHQQALVKCFACPIIIKVKCDNEYQLLSQCNKQPIQQFSSTCGGVLRYSCNKYAAVLSFLPETDLFQQHRNSINLKSLCKSQNNEHANMQTGAYMFLQFVPYAPFCIQND